MVFMNTIYLENVSNMYVECTIYTMHARNIMLNFVDQRIISRSFPPVWL